MIVAMSGSAGCARRVADPRERSIVNTKKRTRRTVLSLIGGVALAFASIQTAQAQPKKLAADLNPNSTANTVDVIVQFHAAADQKAPVASR